MTTWTTGATIGSTMASSWNARSQYSIGDVSSGLSQAVAAGGAYNLLTTMLAANETVRGIAPAFRTIANAAQATFIDQVNDKYLFPSNLYTYGLEYVPYSIRSVLTLNHPNVGSNQSISLYIRIRRVVDNSIVAEKTLIIFNRGATTGLLMTTEFDTFVNGETDPYVLNGMYLEIASDAASSGTITITDINLRIFRS